MASFALICWPVVAMVLFRCFGRPRAVIWTVVAGYLLLPEAWSIDIPALPAYDKIAAIAFALVLGMFISRGEAEPLPKPDRFAKITFGLLLFVIFTSPIVTMLTNRDSYSVGPLFFPAISIWDIQSRLVVLLFSLVPFLVARRVLHSPEAHREILKALVLSGLCYSFLVFFELRMSPQLNIFVYGYFPHAFDQHFRSGGWRPLVFLAHGLELGFFLLMVSFAAIGLIRASVGHARIIYSFAFFFLFAILVLSKNLGALAICILLLPIAFFLSSRLHRLITSVVAVLFITYPLVRERYVQTVVALFERVSVERASSLAFRLGHEGDLLERALERPLAGWGPWGRWRIYSDEGFDVSVSDGIWIIQFGVWGWLGFLGLFGLVVAPALLMRRAAKARMESLQHVTSILLLMLAANLIYMIPNSTLSPVNWLVIGALAAYVQFNTEEQAGTQENPSAAGSSRPIPRYSRFRRDGERIRSKRQ